MDTDLDAEDSRSREGSGPTTRPRHKGKGKTPETARRSAEKHPHDSNPFVACSDGDGQTAGIATRPQAARWEWLEPLAEEGTAHLRARVERFPHLPNAIGKAPTADPRQDPDPDRETWTQTTTWDSARAPTHPAAENPRMVDHLGPQKENHPGDLMEEDHLVYPRAEGHQEEDPLGGPPGRDPLDEPPGADIPEDISRWIVYHKRKIWSLEVRRRSTRSRSARLPPSPPRPRRSWTSPSSRPGS